MVEKANARVPSVTLPAREIIRASKWSQTHWVKKLCHGGVLCQPRLNANVFVSQLMIDNNETNKGDHFAGEI